MVWMPFELRPEPVPTLRPDGSYLQSAWRQSVYPIAKRMGVEIRLPDVTPQPRTLLAFEGLQFAQEHGLGDAYNSAVFRAFFQRSEDIGNPDILVSIAKEVGLDATEFRRVLEEGTYRDRHQKLLRHAVEEVGVQGVPLFVIGQRMLSGLQSKETIEAAIAAAQVTE